MKGLAVNMVRAASEMGQLFGSVTSRDISDAVTEAGFTIDRNQVIMDRSIKTLGLTEARVQLHPEVVVTITVNIARSLAEAETQLETCCSLGLMPLEHLKELKEAGLDRCHHNLETAKSHFDKIVSTHTYEDEVNAVQNAKAAGLQVCVGGIFGMGESFAQRAELGFSIRDLGTQSFPINFLKPIEGTGLDHLEPLEHYEALRTISLLRLILPDIDLFICGGREEVLADQQEQLFKAGANGILGGNYLTTKGQDPKRDIEMIENLGLNPVHTSI